TQYHDTSKTRLKPAFPSVPLLPLPPQPPLLPCLLSRPIPPSHHRDRLRPFLFRRSPRLFRFLLSTPRSPQWSQHLPRHDPSVLFHQRPSASRTPANHRRRSGQSSRRDRLLHSGRFAYARISSCPQSQARPSFQRRLRRLLLHSSRPRRSPPRLHPAIL